MNKHSGVLFLHRKCQNAVRCPTQLGRVINAVACGRFGNLNGF